MQYNYIITHTAMAKITEPVFKAIQTAFDGLNTTCKNTCYTAVRRVIHDTVDDVYFRVTLLATDDRYVQLWHSATPVDVNDTRYPIIEVTG